MARSRAKLMSRKICLPAMVDRLAESDDMLGTATAARMAVIEITAINSISVNPNGRPAPRRVPCREVQGSSLGLNGTRAHIMAHHGRAEIRGQRSEVRGQRPDREADR